MNPHQNEELRHAVLEVLATRHPTALQTSSIRRRIEQNEVLDFRITDEDVNAALMFLAGLTPPLIEFRNDPLGSTKYASASSAGVLAYERGTLQ
jgi:hypothetical protein